MKKRQTPQGRFRHTCAQACRILVGVWIVFSVAPGLMQAWAQSPFPPAPLGREISLWDAPEGLYEREGNLVVVARYNEKTALTNTSQNLGVLLLRAGALMQAYVKGATESDDRYTQVLHARAFSRDASTLLPRANREVARQINPQFGRLALEFPGGVKIIQDGRSSFATLDLEALAQELKVEYLVKKDQAGLKLFAAKQGQVFDELRLGAEAFPRERLFTLGPSTRDLLQDQERILQAFCNETRCALRSRLHLTSARSGAMSIDSAAIHAILARWSADPQIRIEAEASLLAGWAVNPARIEFMAMLQRCAQVRRDSSLASLILTNCGLYWPPLLPTSPALIATADRLFRDGANPGATIQSLVQILEREPAHAKVWSYLGSIFLYLNDDVAAVAALHQALLLDAELIDARLNLAQAYSKTGARILARATYLDVLARLDAGQSAEFVKDARSEATTRLANINSHAPH